MDVRTTLQQYMSDNNLETLFKDLMTSVMYYKPQRPIEFMIDALNAAQEDNDSSPNFAELFRIVAEKNKKKELENKTAPRRVNFGPGTKMDHPQRAKLPPPVANLEVVNFNRRRRVSVSAESLKPSEEGKTERVVIPKTPEARMRIMNAISGNLLFRNLEKDQRQEVMDAMFERKVPKGETIIKQGDEGDNFYVVDEGGFDIFVNDRKVVEIGTGGSFGELALMYNTPRAATVTANTESIVWAVDRVTFRRIIMNNTFRKRKLYESFLRTVPILEGLEASEIVKVSDALEPQTFEDGDSIVEEGDAGDAFYIIVNGDVIVSKKVIKDGSEDTLEVNRLHSGDYFGELALLTDKPRAATVSANGDVECVCLDTKAFIRLLGPCVDILKRNADQYARYANTIATIEQKSE